VQFTNTAGRQPRSHESFEWWNFHRQNFRHGQRGDFGIALVRTSKREDTIDFGIGLKLLKDPEVSADDSEETFEPNFTKKTGSLRPGRATAVAASVRHRLWEYKRDATKERIAELHKQGVKQKDTAKEVGLSQSQVSRILATQERDNSGGRGRSGRSRGGRGRRHRLRRICMYAHHTHPNACISSEEAKRAGSGCPYL
jgi:AraC-like DNA-binding protein